MTSTFLSDSVDQVGPRVVLRGRGGTGGGGGGGTLVLLYASDFRSLTSQHQSELPFLLVPADNRVMLVLAEQSGLSSKMLLFGYATLSERTCKSFLINEGACCIGTAREMIRASSTAIVEIISSS